MIICLYIYTHRQVYMSIDYGYIYSPSRHCGQQQQPKAPFLAQEVKEEVVSDEEKEETPGWKQTGGKLYCIPIWQLYIPYFHGETWCFIMIDWCMCVFSDTVSTLSAKFDLSTQPLAPSLAHWHHQTAQLVLILAIQGKPAGDSSGGHNKQMVYECL